MVKAAYEAEQLSFSAQDIKHAFAVTGMYPFCREKILQLAEKNLGMVNSDLDVIMRYTTTMLNRILAEARGRSKNDGTVRAAAKVKRIDVFSSAQIVARANNAAEEFAKKQSEALQRRLERDTSRQKRAEEKAAAMAAKVRARDFAKDAKAKALEAKAKAQAARAKAQAARRAEVEKQRRDRAEKLEEMKRMKSLAAENELKRKTCQHCGMRWRRDANAWMGCSTCDFFWLCHACSKTKPSKTALAMHEKGHRDAKKRARSQK